VSYDRDSESGNDNALHRFLVNRLGRFSKTDPVPAGGENPQGFDLYSYVRNDPVNKRDPNGRFICDPMFDPYCCTNPDIGYCISVGGDPGGGGGGGCNPDAVEGGDCPNDPEPPPPPSDPQCFCELKYRPVDDWRARLAKATHSFWDITIDDGSEWIVSGGPSDIVNASGFLNVSDVPISQAGENANGKVWWSTGTTVDGCFDSEILQTIGDAFPKNTIVYNAWKGPNSNSAAHYIGDIVGLNPPRPPGAVGWNVAIR